MADSSAGPVESEHELSSDSDDTDNEEDGEEEVLKIPKKINAPEVPMSLEFHPEDNLIGVGFIDGSVRIFSVTEGEDCLEQLSCCPHKKSCRSLKFSQDGTALFSVSKDKSWRVLDASHGKVKQQVLRAHDSSIYSLLVVDSNLIVTGDDDGTIKVWDLRKGGDAVYTAKESEDFISDIDIDEARKIIVTTSGDGTLSAFNVRRRRFDLQSENLHSELLSVKIVRKGEKVVCGAGDGSLNFFNWSEFGNISDRFPGHPDTIDHIACASDSIICTGSADGNIRAVHVLPNRFLGIIGDHQELPIVNLSVNHDSTLLASCAYDQKIKFWNISHLERTNVNERRKAKIIDKSKRLNSRGKEENFFADLM